ncbi:hypothetical protein EYY60_06440 [Flavobacterium zhairuonense]|uniref:hypothetical protein n=1 Tax=Flavobacterium zhairuonense TaxID=2493631 RepID=UPI0010513991|nr:hypothetical protein [Flavobacterium zhairuonense]KAF2512742.1 hypothetical protein EYY60_06440 [Flavobacterium zhairuonense]
MKQNCINSILRVFAIAILFCSCSSDLDFDQVKDLKLEPVYVANLAYFDVPANKLINDGGNQIAYDSRYFDVFKKQFIRDYLSKAEFDIEIENTIQRGFVVNMLLLNSKDQILITKTFAVPAYTGGTNVIKYPTEVFENQRLELLKQTERIGFIVLMTSGAPLDENSLGSLKLRSSATAYFEIEVE